MDAQRWFLQKVDDFSTTMMLISGTVVLIVLILIGTVLTLIGGRDEVDTAAYRPMLVSTEDIPAPPFIGWSEDDMEEPKPLGEFNTISWDQHDCNSDSRFYDRLDRLTHDVSAWSGRTFYNTGYGATLTVQLSNAKGDGAGGVQGLAEECGYITSQDGSTRREGGISQMPVDMGKFDFTSGAEWVTTYSTYNDDTLEGQSSTISVLGIRDHVTVVMTMQVKGAADNNAIRNLELVWRSQAAKLTAMKDDLAAIETA